MKMKVKAAIEMVKKEGWEHVRTKGDHRVFTKEGAKHAIVIPGHLNDDLTPGTLSSILRVMREG